MPRRGGPWTRRSARRFAETRPSTWRLWGGSAQFQGVVGRDPAGAAGSRGAEPRPFLRGGSEGLQSSLLVIVNVEQRLRGALKDHTDMGGDMAKNHPTADRLHLLLRHQELAQDE